MPSQINYKRDMYQDALQQHPQHVIGLDPEHCRPRQSWTTATWPEKTVLSLTQEEARRQAADADWKATDTGWLAHVAKNEAFMASQEAKEQMIRMKTPDATTYEQAGYPEFLANLKAADPVHQPNHYSRYTIEPATFIAANKLPFDVGNVVKYVLRYDAKDGLQDLDKASRYIEMIRERVLREKRVAAGESPQDVWKVML